ncbi:MAG: type II secretion system F family protein [Nitrososphaerota archaeon]|jgi:flagellar protein FlaJ|nr:type II secretion system F family protein [Nitrososphaerota archaeon]GFN42233.1 MAG: pilus assembly protein TadC [Marine Group I thaumarchaeote]
MVTVTKKNRNRAQKTDSVSSFQIFSYKLLNDRVQFLYPKLSGLEKTLKQAMMPMPFDVYVCSIVFSSLLAAIFGVAIGLGISIFMNVQPVAFAVLLPIIVGAGLGQMTFFILQILPAINVKTRSSKLTEELPHFIGYMATLATNGLSLEGIFKAIAKEETNEEIVKDSKFITRNIHILGMDLLTAISDLIKRTPKGTYAELLEGAIITTQTGGDLKEYFLATAKVQLAEKKMSLRKTTESLGIIAEMYTILLIVFPLMAVIMLSIMAIMSPDLAGFDLITLMNLLTYVLVPFFGVLILFMMDTMVPKR